MKKITAIIITCLLLCCFVGIASAAAGENLIVNGDFSTGNLNGWTYSTQPATGTAYITAATDSGSGKTAALFRLAVPTTISDVPKTSISQDVDLTNVNTLTWKTKQWTKSTSGSAYNLFIYKDGVQIAAYYYSQLGSDWTQRSYDVSSITGTVTITFEGQINGYEGQALQYVGYYLTDITAIDAYTNPSVTGISYKKSGATTTTPAFLTGETVTVSYTYSAGSASNTQAIITWGDGSQNFLTTGTNTVTHTYSSVSSYTPKITVYDNNNVVQQTDLSTAYVIGLDFSAEPVSADPGDTIYFTGSPVVPEGTSIVSYSWNYGDGTASTISGSHTYSTNGIYNVSLTVTLSQGSGYTVTKTKYNYINIATQDIFFNTTEIQSGGYVNVSWSLRESNYPYTLNVYPAYNTGERSDYSTIQTHPISSDSDTSFVFPIGTSGYYTAYVEKNGQRITYTTSPVNVISAITLTVKVMDNGVDYTIQNATVKLYNSAAVLLDTKTTNPPSSSVTFNIETGDYYVTIEAANQTMRTSPVLKLSDSYILTMDFTLGASESSYVGVGSQYATTFVTFRTQDSGTGRYIADVQIIAEAIKPTNAWEYFVNLFGASLGQVIQSMTLSGMSDSDGRITFAMYQNVRYRLNITYDKNGVYYQEERAFQQSAMSGEYLIDIPITDMSATRYTEIMNTAVNTSGESIVTNFTDYTGTVTNCTIYYYKKDGDKRELIENATVTYYNPVKGIPQLNTYSPENAAGNSYIVSFVITSTQYGQKVQEYGVTFAGVAVKLGDIPNDWYIWISFAILLMTGAVATFVNSRHFAIVVCIVATLLFFAGWLNALGPAGPIALVICYVLTIVYYIANHNGGGV